MADGSDDARKKSALQNEIEDVEEVEDASPLEHESSSDLSEEHFRHAKALCRGIKKVVMAANLYEPEHALMEGFFMELHGKMGAYLDLYHEFLLEVSSEELRLQGTTVFRVDQRDTGITHRLFLEGVRHIGFHEGIPLEEVKSMILLWSRSLYEDETDDQNFATRFWDLELSFVTAATLDAFSEDAAISREEKEKREEDIEAMLRSILDGSRELEGEKFGLSADELPAYARADLRDLVIEYRGMSAEELAQKWSVDIMDITQEDRDGYSQRIVADEMSVVQRALRAMLGSLTRGDATERDRVLDLTTRVLGALVARGHPTEAAQAVAQLNLIFQNDEWISNDARQIVREAVSNDKVLLPGIKLLDNPPTARVASSILNNVLATRVDVMVTRLRSFKTPEGRRLLASLIKVREPTPEMVRTLVEKSDLDMYEEALFIADGGDMQIVDQVWRSGLIHPNVSIRRRALKSVPKPRVMVLRDALHPLLNDAEKDIRTQVRDLIVSARDQGSIERFARIFNNSRLHEDERRTAITAVATIGGPEASRVLMQGLAELNMPDLRVACALALGNHGDATAIPLLESIANKIVTWKSVRDACKEAVNRIHLRSGGTQTRGVAASSIRSRAQPGGGPKAATSRAAAPKKSLDELPPKIIRMIEEGLIPIPKGYEARKVEAKPPTMKATRQAVLMPSTGGSLFDRAPMVSQTIRPAEDQTSRKEKKVGGSDLDIVFDGYVMFHEKGEVIFGRRWGAQLTDVHAYAAPDIRVAYAHFLIDKIREEFLPQNERQRMILPSHTLIKLDLGLLDLVYAEVKDSAKKGEQMSEPEQRPGIDLKDDEAVQLIGRELLTKLGLCFRISTMYNLDNNVLIKPIDGLCDVVNRMIEHYGGCNFNNVGENYYVNTQPIKLDTVTFDVSNALMKILRRMAVNEIAIGGQIDPHGVRSFLRAFQVAWEHGDPKMFREECPTPFSVRAVQAAAGKKSEDVNLRQEVLRRYAIVAMQVDAAARDLMAGRTAGMSRVRRAVQALADSCTGHENVLAAVLSLYKSTGVVAHHLTATMAICLLIGRKLGLANRALSDLCMTAVLHDVALVDLPKSEQAKAEIGVWREALHRAPDKTGFALCMGGISLGSLSRAASAHEHLIPVKSITATVAPGEMSRILAVACAYETLTSAEPPGVDMPPDRALWAILSGAGTRFEPIACKALATTLGLYPVGTTVRLDGGQEALVVNQQINPRFWHRPHVVILGLGLEVDLSQSSRRILGSGQPLAGDVLTEYFIEAPDREQAPPE